MNEQHPLDPADAARALESISGTRREVASRVGSPPHYYTKLGVGLALICLSQPVEIPLKAVATFVAIALFFWAIRSYVNATGTFTMATLREPGAWMAWTMMAVMLAALAASTIVQTWAVCIPSAVAAFVVPALLGPQWDAAWVRSLERDA